MVSGDMIIGFSGWFILLLENRLHAFIKRMIASGRLLSNVYTTHLKKAI